MILFCPLDGTDLTNNCQIKQKEEAQNGTYALTVIFSKCRDCGVSWECAEDFSVLQMYKDSPLDWTPREHRRNHILADPQRVIEEVSLHLGIRRDQIISRRRPKETVRARQICMYLLRNVAQLHLKEIGLLLNRDHSTVSWGIDSIDIKIHEDNDFALEMYELIEKVDVK